MQRRVPDIVKITKSLLAFLKPIPKNQPLPISRKALGRISSVMMKMIWICLLFVFAFMAVHLLVCSGPIYSHSSESVHNVHNVHYVDSSGRNFLFRGGLPLTQKHQVFNYNGLKQAIITAGITAGIKVPNDFFIIDVNLLNVEEAKDRERIYVEQQFFKTNPRLGFIQVWGMVGTGISATNPSLASNRDYLGRNLDSWLCDRLSSRIEILRQWLMGSSWPDSSVTANLPIVIYVHCVAGCDRTGEFIGAYYLRYMNKSWEQMNALNQSMCPHSRPYHCRNYRADQWYCLWLNLERGLALNWQKEFPCSGK
jgi:hypothetical protein